MSLSTKPFASVTVNNQTIDFWIRDRDNRLLACERISQKSIPIANAPTVAPKHRLRCYRQLHNSHTFFQGGELVITPRACGGAPGEEKQETPDEFICSITHQIMFDPVLAADGETYEREAIQRHIDSSDLSPLHGDRLAHKILTPNRALKRSISAFLETVEVASEELYLPTKLIEDCRKALLSENLEQVKTLVKKEPRLWAHSFDRDQTLFDISLQTTTQTLEKLLTLYPKEHLPKPTDQLLAQVAKQQGSKGLQIVLKAYPGIPQISHKERLFQAIDMCSYAYVKALLDLRADPGHALFRAVLAGDKRIITLLMERGANSKQRDAQNRTPIELAHEIHRPHLAQHIAYQKQKIKMQPHIKHLEQRIKEQAAFQLATLQAIERIADAFDSPACKPIAASCQPIRNELRALHTTLSQALAKPEALRQHQYKKESPETTRILETDAENIIPMAFGKDKWAQYFGNIGIEPPLPANIEEILNGPCRIFPGKKIKDTHVLTLIPSHVNGQQLTLEWLGELVKHPKGGGNATKYCYWKPWGNEKAHVEQNTWVLLTRNVIPGSRNKPYADQYQLIKELAQKSGQPYEVPYLIEAAVSCFMEYVSTGKHIYSDDPWTYTRCQEKKQNEDAMAVGGFGSSGLCVNSHWVFGSCGVGGLRKF